MVEAVLFLVKVELPVAVEVAVGDQGAKVQDGLGSGQAPAGAGAVHAVVDQVAAGALDDAGGDRPPAGQRGGVVQAGFLASR